MPSWEIHNKYAKKMGVSEEASKFVNKLIDSPNEVDEYQGTRYIVKEGGVDFYENHDAGRSRVTPAKRQLDLLASKGEEYIETWYLHHLLDYIKTVKHSYGFEEILNRFREKKTVERPELDTVEDFVKQNKESILREL